MTDGWLIGLHSSRLRPLIVLLRMVNLSQQHRKAVSEPGCFLRDREMQYAPSVPTAAITLSNAQFYGGRFRTVQTDSFVCAEGEATGSERDVPRHSHSSSHFVLVGRGTYITEARNEDGWYGPGTLIYNPMGTTHRDRFHNGCGRFLTIGIEAGFSTRVTSRLHSDAKPRRLRRLPAAAWDLILFRMLHSRKTNLIVFRQIGEHVALDHGSSIAGSNRIRTERLATGYARIGRT